MKRALFAWLIMIVLLFVCIPGSFAAEVLSVSGNDYSVIMLCLDDAGDYCAKEQISQDEFQFQGNGDFKITSLENKKDLIDSSSGSYDVSAAGFSGDYEITIDNRLKKYTFSFSGFSAVDTIILGQFDVNYYEFGGFPPDYDKKGEAKAYFLGFRQ